MSKRYPLSEQELEELECEHRHTSDRRCADRPSGKLARNLARSVSDPSVEVPKPDEQTVDADSLELVRLRTVGVKQVGLRAMRQVVFIQLLVELGISGPLRAAIGQVL